MSRVGSGVLAVVGVLVLLGTLRLGTWTTMAPTSCDDPPKLNIFRLEFARTADRARELLDIDCGPEQLHHQLHRDGLYIAVYSLAISGFALIGTSVLGGWWQSLARVMVVGGLVAGALDVVENALLNRVANGDYGAAAWVFVVTIPKWILGIVGIVVGVATIVGLAKQAVTG